MNIFRAPTLPLADPGHPQRIGPWYLLFWLLTRRKATVAGAIVLSLFGLGAMSAFPFFVSGAIDHGLTPQNWSALAWWSAGMVIAGFVTAIGIIMGLRLTVYIRQDAAYRALQIVTGHITKLGSHLTRRVSTGEIVSVGATDVRKVSVAVDGVFPGFGAIAAFALVGILLYITNPYLALLVLVGVVTVGVVTGPVLQRFQSRQSKYREEIGLLTSRASDIVGGLRVLRGIGGERQFHQRYRHQSQELRAAGYRVARPKSAIEAIGEGTPSLLLVLTLWLSARMVISDTITIGEMVAAYGYVLSLMLPTFWIMGATIQLIEGRVASGRIASLLQIPLPDHDEPTVDGPGDGADLHDPESGLEVPGQKLTAVVANDSETNKAIFDRLGRYSTTDAEFGGVRVTDLDSEELRRRILVADHDAYLFAGTVHDIISAGKNHAPVEAAVHAAAADDIIGELTQGLDTPLRNQARTLSGGQRQRLRLARAIAANHEVLLLNEPSSAVDSHTEASIVARVRENRKGKTTVVATSSPLWLTAADSVSYLEDGKVVAFGTHRQLLETSPEYHAHVTRGES